MDTIQLDVTTAFLYADIDETIYVEPPRDLRVIFYRENCSGGWVGERRKTVAQEESLWTIDAFLRYIGLCATKWSPVYTGLLGAARLNRNPVYTIA